MVVLRVVRLGMSMIVRFVVGGDVVFVFVLLFGGGGRILRVILSTQAPRSVFCPLITAPELKHT